MDNDTVRVRASGILSHIKIRVTGMAIASMRCRIGGAILAFGAFIAGCALEIEADDHRV